MNTVHNSTATTVTIGRLDPRDQTRTLMPKCFHTYKNQSIAKSNPIPSDGIDSVVQIITIVTSEELVPKEKIHTSKL